MLLVKDLNVLCLGLLHIHKEAGVLDPREDPAGRAWVSESKNHTGDAVTGVQRNMRCTDGD